MSEIRALIEQLIDAGVDPVDAAEVITRAALHGAASAPKAKSAGAVRQERYRRNKASQVTVSDDCNAEVKENTPTPPKENNPPKPPKGGISPRQELLAVLDAERADAVIQHRQRLRKPLTARAAKLLAAKLGQAADPNAAADLMVERGWQGFEPGWGGLPETSSKPKVSTIKTDAEMTPEELRAAWAKRLNFGRMQRQWFPFWGPMPGQPGCTCPPDMLEPKDGQHPNGRPWDIKKIEDAA